MKEKICIVVPVYNVEKFLNKCLLSIKNQTYKNFDAIIVNDGSTDNSLQICEDVCSNDKRFKIVSKKNGGLSDARNYGMRYCKCKYITFIDSDDYVSEKYIENLVKLMISKKADISCTNYVHCYENNTVDKMNSNIYEKTFNGLEAIKNVLYQKDIQNSAWGKLYRFDLFDDVSFPVGKLCEDLGTFYKLFEKCKKIAYNSTQDYYYLQRSNSIMGSSFNEKKLDGLKFCNEILEYYKQSNNHALISAAIYRIAAECMFLIKRIPKDRNDIRKSIKKEMKMVFKEVMNDKNVSLSFKIKYFIYYLF